MFDLSDSRVPAGFSFRWFAHIKCSAGFRALSFAWIHPDLASAFVDFGKVYSFDLFRRELALLGDVEFGGCSIQAWTRTCRFGRLNFLSASACSQRRAIPLLSTRLSLRGGSIQRVRPDAQDRCSKLWGQPEHTGAARPK